ncbi:MAG: hypothetical protein CMB99_01850 [Flavobacteriaceae bacterium]|nr:hypothetical protein [Flavobacteriaceae bacterium]|tara:strand:- start:20296 stop:21456 length:1161 start_codon:yes stop_codon:yes gene_type:complete
MNKWLKKHGLLLKDAFFSTIFCLLLTLFLALIVVNLSFLNPFKEAFKDFSFTDIYYSERIQEQSISKDIVLINIERRDRFELGMLLESILAENPKVVGVDAIFRNPKDSIKDAYLAQQLQNSNVVSAINFDKNGIIRTHESLKPAKESFINISFDTKTKVVRTFESFHENNDQVDTSFVVSLAKAFGKTPPYTKLEEEQFIKYSGNYKSFIHFGFDEFMLLEDKKIIQDKIVLLGYLGVPMGNNFDVEDKFFTPLNSSTSGKSLPDMFGIVVHANILKMVLENDYIIKLPKLLSWILNFGSVFLFMVFSLKLEKRGEIYNRTFKWLILFLYTAILLYLHLMVYDKGVYFNVFSIIALTGISANMFIFYVHFLKLIKSKIQWKSYLD